MSEEKCLIQQSEAGEISASFSQSKVSFLNTDNLKDSETSCADDIPLTNQSLNHQNDIARNIDENNDAAYEEALFIDTEGVKESEFQYCSNENLNVDEPAASSTPLLTRERSETSLTGETSQPKAGSPTVDCCIGGDPEEDNESTSQVSCGCSYHEDGECTSVPVVKIQPREGLMIPGSIQVPIVGHETMEARSKFTVSDSVVHSLHTLYFVKQHILGFFFFLIVFLNSSINPVQSHNAW